MIPMPIYWSVVANTSVMHVSLAVVDPEVCFLQWLRGRASDSRLREPGFDSCAAVLKPWASLFTLHCSNSLSCINEYLAIDSGVYVFEQPSRNNCSIWLDASQRSRDGV